MSGGDAEDEFMRDARRFRLVRDEDESGVSGTGVVAVGVELPSGAAVFEWLNDENPDLSTTQNGLTVKPGPDGIEDLIEVHGHGGRTRVEWVDPSRAVREGDAVPCYECGIEIPVSEIPDSSDVAYPSCPACGENMLPPIGGGEEWVALVNGDPVEVEDLSVSADLSDEFRSALSEASREAANHGGEYANGMRNARAIIEEEFEASFTVTLSEDEAERFKRLLSGDTNHD